MTKKHKTREELQAELNLIKRSNSASSFTIALLTIVRYMFFLGVMYFVYLSIAALAGQQTSANIVIDFLGKIEADRWIGYIVGGAGLIYGALERKQRKVTVKRVHGRQKTLESIIDSKRTTSNLTESGNTNPSDKQ